MDTNTAPSSIGKTQRKRRNLMIRLSAAQDDLCFYCDELMDVPEPKIAYTNSERNSPNVASFEHVRPKSRNGRNNGPNIVIAHRSCNTERDVKILTIEQGLKLDQLNQKRSHMFTEQHGKISPTTFGIVSLSSIVLAEKINEDDFPQQERKKICKFIQDYLHDVKEIDVISNNDTWLKVSDLLIVYYYEHLAKNTCLLKTYIETIIASIKTERYHRRFA